MKRINHALACSLSSETTSGSNSETSEDASRRRSSRTLTASSCFPSLRSAFSRHQVKRSRPSWTPACSSKAKPASSSLELHASASAGACCQPKVRRATESESSRFNAKSEGQCLTVPAARCSKSSSASKRSLSAFLQAFLAAEGTSWPA